MDAPSEAQLSASFGLYSCDMNRTDRHVPTHMKKSYDVYRYIDKSSKTLEVTEFAKSIIGIDNWYDVIPKLPLGGGWSGGLRDKFWQGQASFALTEYGF